MSTRKFFLQVFLRTSIPFGLFMAVFAGFTKADRGVSVNEALAWAGATFVGAGLMFGLGMTAFAGLSMVLMKRAGIPVGQPVSQSREAVFEEPIDELTNRCRRALANIKAKIVQDQGSVIHARTSMSWKSFGEAIQIAVTPSNDRTKVIISSQPTLKTTFLDYGKNWQNVESLMASLASKTRG